MPMPPSIALHLDLQSPQEQLLEEVTNGFLSNEELHNVIVCKGNRAIIDAANQVILKCDLPPSAARQAFMLEIQYL